MLRRQKTRRSEGQEAAPTKKGFFRIVGNGIITGAADDGPSAIGTYASAGAKFGFAFLWIAPMLLPMMYLVVYLSAKLGRVYGKGFIAVVRDKYPRWVLYPTMLSVFLSNIVQAAADLGGIGAAVNLLVPVPIPAIVVGAGALILILQVFGSYSLLRRLFRWLALALFAYMVAAILAKPDLAEVLRGTFIPSLRFDSEFLSVLVACIGASLSVYILVWQSNQEVEDQIAIGRSKAYQRKGASDKEMRRTRRDVVIGMVFSNIILYFVLLSTGATLHASGHTSVESAAQAAVALEPIAGKAAKLLFALGVVGVGFLAVPVMTTGAAYGLVQGLGRKGSLHAKFSEAKLFYAIIALVTAIAVLMNFLGINPMKALVWSSIVQGFTVPPLLLLMMLMTNDRQVMGQRTNGRLTNALGWITFGATFLAALCLIITLVM